MASWCGRKQKIVFLFIMTVFILLTSSVFGYPLISWESPTPEEDEYKNEDFAYLNTTITDTSNTSAFLDWNHSLVGYWNFEYYNATGVFDNSSYNHFGTFSATTFGEDNLTAAKYGDGIVFDGVDDCINLGNSDDFDITENFTIEAWINPKDQWPYGDRILDKLRGSAYAFRLVGDRIELAVTIDGNMNGGNNYSTGSFTANVWNHVVATYNGSVIQYYIDGLDAGTASPSPSGPVDTNNEVLSIGGSYSASAYWFNGSIDEVRIHNRILSAQEINASYNNSVYRLKRNFTGLIDGTYDYEAWAIDLAGNMNTSSRNVTIDITSPHITWESPTPDDGNVTSDTHVYLNTTITDTSNTSAFLDWNHSLVGYWSFEHTNSTHVFDNSSYGNDGSFEYNNYSSTADGSDTNGTQCVDDDTLFGCNGTHYNGWTFEVTSGDAVGNTSLISDYIYFNATRRILYLAEDVGDFQVTDSYKIYYDSSGPTLVTGKYGQGLYFDGGNDYIVVEQDDSEAINETLTIEAWINPLGYQKCSSWNLAYILEKGYGDFDNYGFFVTNQNQLGFEFANIDGDHVYYYDLVGDIILGEWQHVAVTYDDENDEIVFYRNGEVVNTRITTHSMKANQTNDLWIGSQNFPSYNFYFNGSMDEIRIHDRVLSLEEIKASYNSFFRGPERNFTGLPEGVYDYEAWAIDLAGNMNSTGRTITVNFPPKYWDNSTNSTFAGTLGEFRLRWTDALGLDGYIFSFCNGTWNGNSCGEDVNWWNTSFQKCRNVTVSQGYDDYQYKLVLNSSFDYSYTNDSGNDIRIVNAPCGQGGSLMKHWTEEWNEAGNSTIWFRGGSSTTTYSIYYNFTEAEDKSNGTETFIWFDQFDTNTLDNYINDNQVSYNANGWVEIGLEQDNADGYMSLNFSEHGLEPLESGIIEFVYNPLGVQGKNEGRTDQFNAREDYDGNTSYTWIKSNYATTRHLIRKKVWNVNVDNQSDSEDLDYSNQNHNISLIWNNSYYEVKMDGETDFSLDCLNTTNVSVGYPYWKTRQGEFKFDDLIIRKRGIPEPVVSIGGQESIGYSAWENDTWTDSGWDSAEEWSNVTKFINSTVGSGIAWKVYANDTYDAWNVSRVYSFIAIDYYELTGKVIFWENATIVPGASVVARVYDGNRFLAQGSDTTDSQGDYLILVGYVFQENKRYLANITVTKDSYQSYLKHYFRI